MLYNKKHDTSFDFYSTRLATCSSDGTVSIYDTSNENERKILSTFKVYERNNNNFIYNNK
jgi:hypothetical protein